MINAVIIDTSAIIGANCDFLGINDSIIPSLFDCLQQQQITLLSHPILDYEIKKHITDSGIYPKLSKLISQIKKEEYFFTTFKIPINDILQTMENYKLDQKLLNAFETFYKESLSLPYSNPESVFEQYFSNESPFAATGNKKSEFPDAFVIMSIKQYLKSHPEVSLLVISKDTDWEKSFKDCTQVKQTDTILGGVYILQQQQQQQQQQFIISKFSTIKALLEEYVIHEAQNESYVLEGYEYTDDFEVTSLNVQHISDDIVFFNSSPETIILQTYAILQVSGHVKAIDYDRSFWDREENQYMFLEYMMIDCKNGQAKIKIEVSISFNDGNPEDAVNINSVKIHEPYDIHIDINTDTIIDPKPIFNE